MRILLLLLCCFLSVSIFAQTTIELNNPSFEDEAQPSKAPRGWYNCGSNQESPPDIQPNPTFKVEKPAFHGDTYLGMVTRDNETYEAVGQRIKEPMAANKQHNFSIDLARSDFYVSLSRSTGDEINYSTGVVLRVWGGMDEYCDKKELLYESPRIVHSGWEQYNITFVPSDYYNYITFEAYYVTPTIFPYNGNLLVDNCSAIEIENLELFAIKGNSLDHTNLMDKIKHDELDEEGLAKHPQLLKEITAFKTVLNFVGFLENRTPLKKVLFDSSTEDLKLLIADFQKFELKNTVDLIENVIVINESEHGQFGFLTDDENELVNRTNRTLQEGLKNDNYQNKLNLFLESNMEVLEKL